MYIMQLHRKESAPYAKQFTTIFSVTDRYAFQYDTTSSTLTILILKSIKSKLIRGKAK